MESLACVVLFSPVMVVPNRSTIHQSMMALVGKAMVLMMNCFRTLQVNLVLQTVGRGAESGTQ
jgi:hypothetical protein